MRKYRNSRSIFATVEDEPIIEPQPQAQIQHQSKHRRHKQTNQSYENDSYNQNPIISSANDSIHLTSENYKPNQTLIDITGFSNLSPFMGNDKSHSLDSIHDNAYSDYNETGQNNINDSDYRKRLIKQMQDSVFQQSQSMFGSIERANKNNQYQVDSHYTPSNASAVYLQRQSKQMFNNHRSTIFRED